MKTTVKTGLIILAFLLLGSKLSAQEKHNPNLIPYCEFAPDSIAYLNANFATGPHFYMGGTIKVLLEDLDVPVKSVEVVINTMRPEARIFFLNMYVQDLEQIKMMESKGNYDFKPITVRLKSGVSEKDGELFQKMSDGHRDYYLRAFDDEFRKLVEPLIIEMAHY